MTLAMEIMLIVIGSWTEARGALLNNAPLAVRGFKFGLDKCIILHPGTPSVSEKTMATTMEAIFASVHLDGGDAAFDQVMRNLGIMNRFNKVLSKLRLQSRKLHM